jgi:hypothetical protein
MLKSKEAPTQFRGFIGGKQFRTTLGFQGNAFDSLWGKHVFLSLINDDVQLFDVAMSSELADIHDTVTGGENGAAFILGDIGFYSGSQFAQQGNRIRAFELEKSKSTYFLSEREWIIVNDNIKKIANYANESTSRAIRGDSFGALALRSNAYKVARRMIECGMDPLIKNEEGEDLYSILEEQYNHMTGLMHDILVIKEESTHRILVPSEQKDIDNKEESGIQALRDMLEFLNEFNISLKSRCMKIKDDKNQKRRLELLMKIIPKEMLFNIASEVSCNKNLELGLDLAIQLNNRIKTYEKGQKEHVNLSDLMYKQHAVVTSKTGNNGQSGSNSMKVWSYKDDETKIEKEKTPEELALESLAFLSKKKGKKTLLETQEEKAIELELAMKEKERIRILKEKEAIQRSHGIETDTEKLQREEKEKNDEIKRKEEEEAKIMEYDFMEKEKEAEEKKKKDRLLQDSYSPTMGTLHKSEFAEIRYR